MIARNIKALECVQKSELAQALSTLGTSGCPFIGTPEAESKTRRTDPAAKH